MRYNHRRLLSLLLCGVLTASLLAAPIYAEASGAKECTNPSGHKFVNVVDTDPESVGYHPACPNATVYQLKCEYCGEERGYYGGNHAWSAWSVNGDGTQSRSCTLCGAQETGAVPETGHTHTLVTVTTPATCTRDGYTYQRCTKCDYEGPKTVLPATGHDPAEDDDCRTPPRCTVCGELLWDGKTYPAIHNFSGPYEYDETGHWRHCQNPGCSAVSPVELHRTTGGVSDCTKGTVCSECGATVAMGREHNFDNARVGIITAAGHYLICSNPGCGQTQFFPHSFEEGKCAVCGAADPDYKPAQEPERGVQPAGQMTQKKQEEQTDTVAPEAQMPQGAQPTQETQASQEAQTTQMAQAVQVTTVAVAEKFSDVGAKSWYTDSVQRVVEAGLMNGVSDSAFSPATNVNRAMLATILYRLAGQPGPGIDSFSDVKATAYYSDAVSWAATMGIVTGYGNNTFLPNQDITRQELATVLYRYAMRMGCDVSQTGDLNAFADVGQIASWARQAMAWANGVGIINGRAGNHLAPTVTATRAEVATMIARFMDVIEGL